MATPEELAQFSSSGRYRVTDLVVQVYRYSDTPDLEFHPIIGVTDIVAGETYPLHVLKEKLAGQKESLERSKEEKVALRSLSFSSFETIRQRMKDWKVQKSGETTYDVSGFGLGWVDNKLTSGRWVFNANTGQMTPVDSEGIALVSLLIAR